MFGGGGNFPTPRNNYTPLLSHVDTWYSLSKKRLSAFADSVWYDEDYLNFNPSDSLRLLVKYTERLSRIGLEQEKGHALIKHASARLYELVRSFIQEEIIMYQENVWGKGRRASN